MLRQDRVRISSSHRPIPAPVSSNVGRKASDDRHRIHTAHRENAKRQAAISSAFDKAWKQRLVRVLASDGVLRASAHDSARKSRSSKRIERLPRVLRTYCAMLMGYDDKYVVEEYLFVRMKQLFTARLANVKTKLERSLPRSRRMTPETCKSYVAVECRPLTRLLADELAEAALTDLEQSLLDLAGKGRRMRNELPRNYVAVQVRVAGLGRTTSAVLILDAPTGEFSVKAFQTAREFNRVQRLRFRQRAAFANRPLFVRH